MQILLATEGKWGKWAKRGGESSRVVQISSNRTWLNWVGFIINGELGEEGKGGRGRWKGGEYGEGILVFGHVIE